VDALKLRQDGIYLDATFGRGGHAARILAHLGRRGRLIALDADPEAIAHARARFGEDSRLELVHCNFRALGEVLATRAPQGVDGILIDLGVSSPQLDQPERGFSFRHDGPLDMRMNPEHGPSAAAWLAAVEESDLVDVLFRYGEERHARRIARAICRARAAAPIRTTARLADIVAAAVPGGAGASRVHPATRTFQAIRIVVNDELAALEQALEAAIAGLAPGGRLVVISFHSLEDRLVKDAIRLAAKPPPASRRKPVAESFQPTLKVIGKLVRPGPDELEVNPRARSARMRVAEKCLPQGRKASR